MVLLWGPQERQFDSLPAHWHNHSLLILGVLGVCVCLCVCMCAAGTVPVRQPGWYFSAGSAETWPSQHHGGVNQWNPIRHHERWERNWAAKKAPTETKSETFLGGGGSYVNPLECKSNIFAAARHARALFVLNGAGADNKKATYLRTASLMICGRFKRGTVWDLHCVDCVSHVDASLCLT